MLLSNVLREYITEYKNRDSESLEEFENIMEFLEDAYVNGSISKIEYNKFLNDLGECAMKK